MQLRDVNYYSDVLISIDIYVQRHSKRALGWGRGRTKCILKYHLSPHSIIKGGPSQVGGPYTWWGGEGGAFAPMLHPMPHTLPSPVCKTAHMSWLTQMGTPISRPHLC